jgi:hypothetical protein
MSWAPTDLVSDADLTAYESKILTSFNVSDWAEKRRRALEDWLAPILRGRGYDLARLRTRFEPEAVLGFTGAAYTDKTAAATDATTDDVDLAAVFATPGTDALYIGSTQSVPWAVGAVAGYGVSGRRRHDGDLLERRLDGPDGHGRHGQDDREGVQRRRRASRGARRPIGYRERSTARAVCTTG